MENIIEIKHLSKHFGEVRAVDDCSLSVKQGELFALLGVNGAGKSTTIKILCGLLSRDGGEVRINGADPQKNREAIQKEVGVVFQNSLLDRALSVRDNLVSRGTLYGLYGEALQSRIAELAERLDFERLLSRTVGKLSGGERRRIDIARALLHRPRLLILDEPTTGLDPQTRKLLWSVVEDLRKEAGMTVLLTTHYMEEAADADHVVILDDGKIAAEGTPLELKNTYSRDFITLYGVGKEAGELFGLPYEVLPFGVRLSVGSTAEATALILAHPERFSDYEITKGKMDDVFLAVTGKKLTGGQNDA